MLKKRKLSKCFPRAVSYCCINPEAKEVSYIRLGAGRSHSCVRDTISFEDLGYGRKSPNRLLAATTETQRQVQNLKEIPGTVSKRVECSGVIRS